MAVENDVVLIYFEDNPVAFARIEDISADIKADWYHVKLLMLQLPLQTVTWILKDIYINGEEFTMGGKRMRLEKIVAPDEKDDEIENEKQQETDTKPKQIIKKESKKSAKVVSLADRRK